MSLNIQNNVSMSQNNITFKAKEKVVKKYVTSSLNQKISNVNGNKYVQMFVAKIKGSVVNFKDTLKLISTILKNMKIKKNVQKELSKEEQAMYREARKKAKAGKSLTDKERALYNKVKDEIYKRAGGTTSTITKEEALELKLEGLISEEELANMLKQIEN